ncbi:Uncharacterised protein [Streptococcus pneumoniae]|uniref:hypothetical protein n=1 Tax=Bacillus cereus group TaxID=86661 RepID=UPI0005E804B5|nr:MULTISPECIES: hypothetical protein [Bacillus cereus group]MDA1509530.1 hypothetical protein [Bacillus cereus group sp. TH36-2LC]CKE95530.1 Uncharacterised protein [Bacillus paranthracis]CKG21395.1 Uncharacterised protein [Streptococcus pneumoniae]CKG33412.1 Uncharacterised protein [Streptococcus pneumoniae]
MVVERLQRTEYALKNSHKRLKEAFAIMNDEHQMYATLGETLLWIVATNDWHMEFNKENYLYRQKRDTRGILLFGLRHAYNMVKHNMNFIELHKTEAVPQFTFPVVEPPVTFCLIKVLWKDICNIPCERRYENQKQNYIKYLQGKEVLETISQAIKFLLEENEKYEQTYSK